MKKLLALVLALVMSMSLVTISNAAFKDADKIDYKEAVDVMNAVGVFVGDEKGNFNAKENLTREQAAKIIAYLELGSKAADALVGGATFTDVAASRWSAGFVGYCAQAGVVAGVGDGKFDPAGQLTALQFGKMLLVELGYDAKAAGMTGTDWAINTSKLMAKAKLMDGIDGSVNQVLTREQAAQMTLNALEAPTVEYENKGSSIIVNGAEINLGASEPTYVTNTIAKEQTISNEKLTNNGGYTIELGEKLYKNLKKISTSDDFARPATKWTWKSETVGTYADKADLTYTAKVEAGDIYKDLNLSDAIAVKGVKIYVDGNEYTGTDLVAIKKGSDAKVGDSGNGVLTEVFYDDVDNTVIITMVNTYIGSIAKTVKATAKKDAYVVITAESESTPKSGFDKNFETDETFADDTYVLYTYSLKADAIKSVVAAEKVEGTVTRAENDKKNVEDKVALTIDGTRYKASAKIGGEDIGDVSVKKDYTIYLDSYGYMIYVEEIEEIGDYALILNIATSNNDDWYYGNRVELVFTDGTTKVVTTEKNYRSTMNRFDIVTYKADSNNVYTLKALDGDVYKADVGSAFKMTNDKAGLTVPKNSNDTTGVTKYANSASVFVVRNTDDVDDWTSYTGIKTAPSITTEDADNKDASVAYYCKSGNMITVMFVLTESSTDVSDASKNALFIAKGSVSNLIHDEDGDYFEYTAVDGKEIKTIKVDSTAKVNGTDRSSKWIKANVGGLYKSCSVNSKGIITSLTTYADKYTGSTPYDGENTCYIAGQVGIDKTSKEYTVKIGLKDNGGKVSYRYTLTVADDADIYYVNTDNEISVASYKEITPDTNDEVYTVIDDYMIQTLIIYQKDDSDNGDDDDTTSVIKGTKSTIARSAASLKTVANGAYTFPSDATISGINDINGGIQNNIFFKFATKEADQTVALEIKNGDGDTVYLESAGGSNFAKGGHFFYVQVIGENLGNAGDGPMKNAALETGTYSWTVSVDGDVTVSGEFTIA